MKKIEFIQHIPDFCDQRDIEREHLCFDSLEELLEAKKDWLENKSHKDLVFAYGNCHNLMVSSKSEEWWWVIGFVYGIDLSEYLPKFDEVYKDEIH